METPALITTLEDRPAAFNCFLIEDRKAFAKLRCPTAISPRSLVKWQANDCLWMGEVVDCLRDGDLWIVCVCVDHVLHGISGLALLKERFIGTEREREKVEA